jgi:ubiquinone/menaquinone biosynthesis C-methylase UbiE
MAATTAFVGTVPEYYDRCLGPVMFSAYAQRMAERVAALAPRIVLETAAGTGAVTRAMLAALPASTRITATDLSADMLEWASREIGANDRVTLQQADAQALAFSDSNFDCVVCQFGVMFYPDKDLGFREALRVLKPGGRYLFSFWDGLENNPFARIRTAYMQDVLGEALPPNNVTPFIYTIEAAKASLLSAGFEEVEASVIRMTREITDPVEFATGHIRGTSVTATFEAIGLDLDKAAGALARRFREELGENPCSTQTQAILMSARKPI